jgi:mRNA-degrading endonuclease RelE of RelBE toxin-antitoxin system
MRVFIAPSFERAYRKLPESVVKKLERKQDVFLSDPFHPSLRTHGLGGRMSHLYSFSVDKSYRVVFQFTDDGGVILIDVGTHAVYR